MALKTLSIWSSMESHQRQLRINERQSEKASIKNLFSISTHGQFSSHKLFSRPVSCPRTANNNCVSLSQRKHRKWPLTDAIDDVLAGNQKTFRAAIDWSTNWMDLIRTRLFFVTSDADFGLVSWNSEIDEKSSPPASSSLRRRRFQGLRRHLLRILCSYHLCRKLQ